MRVAAKIKLETAIGRLAVEIGRVGQQYGEGFRRNRFNHPLQVVGFVEMRIIDAAQPEGVVAPLQRDGFIQQQANAARFECVGHFNEVMIAENGEGIRLDRLAEPQRFLHGAVVAVEGALPEVAGDDAEVILQRGQPFDEHVRQFRVVVQMQVAQMQEGEAVERGREIGEDEPVLPDLERQAVAASDAVESGQLERGADDPVQAAHPLDMQEGAADTGHMPGVVMGLQIEPLRQMRPAHPLFKCFKINHAASFVAGPVDKGMQKPGGRLNKSVTSPSACRKSIRVMSGYPSFSSSLNSPCFPRAARYARLVHGPDALAEPGAVFLPCSERHLQCVWFDDALRPEGLTTVAGEPVEVEAAGRWNAEAGPDFLDAVLRVGRDRRRICGDLEIHLQPGDWRNHRHGSDSRYGRVRFHVTWRSGPGGPAEMIEIPLAAALTARPGFHFENIDLSAYPHSVCSVDAPCCAVLKTFAPDERTALLEAAGEERMRRRAESMRQQFGMQPPEQVLYEGLMAGLGYKHNKAPFRELARRVPLYRLCAETGSMDEAYAVLAGVAGLLPAEPDRTADAEARAVLKQWWGLWFRQRERWEERRMERSAWRLAGVRPANHPLRRLAAAAVWFSGGDELPTALRRRVLEGPAEEAVNRLTGLLVEARHPFWSFHRSLRSPRLETAEALAGAERVQTLLINTVIPWLAAAGTAPEKIAELMNRLPPEPLNRVIRDTAFRLLGPDVSPALYASCMARQGLIQIYHDFCLNRGVPCSDCLLPGRLRGLAE